MLQLLLFSGLAFFLMLPLMKRTLTISLDTDWVWRRLIPAAWNWTATGLTAVRDKAGKDLATARNSLGQWFGLRMGEQGQYARSWPISTTALWIAALLAAYVVAYYR